MRRLIMFNHVTLDVDAQGARDHARRRQADERLIDEYKIVVNPLVLGKGRTLFEACGHPRRGVTMESDAAAT